MSKHILNEKVRHNIFQEDMASFKIQLRIIRWLSVHLVYDRVHKQRKFGFHDGLIQTKISVLQLSVMSYILKFVFFKIQNYHWFGASDSQQSNNHDFIGYQNIGH